MKQHRQLSVKFILGILSLLVLYSNAFSYVILNRGDEAYVDNEKRISIQSKIIEGASFFLKSYSDSLLILQMIEQAQPESLNFNELKIIVNQAIDNMKGANTAYLALKELADITPYNPVFIDRLKSFDYAGFQYANTLDGEAFDNTKTYLYPGDVRGIFNHILAGTGQLLNMLQTIKASVDAEKFPELSNLWRMNQLFAEIMLTGQYAAEIFYEVSDN